MLDHNTPDSILARARVIKEKHNSIARERECEEGAYIVCRKMTLDEAVEIAENEAIENARRGHK